MEFLIIFSLFGILLGVFAVRAAATRSRAPLKEAGVAFLAGVTAGVVWSIGARLAMRIVALIDGREPEFSVGGTLVILIAGVMFGTPLALLFALVRRWLPGTGLRKGLSYGAILLALGIAPFSLLGASDLDSSVASVPVLIGTALFGGLFLLFGLTVEAVRARLSRKAPVATAIDAGTRRLTAAG